MTNHYYNLNRLLSKALAHGVDSEETEKAIREDATNMYVDGQLKIQRDAIASKLTEALNKYSKSINEGGLDYKKAFEEVEALEKKLYEPTL